MGLIIWFVLCSPISAQAPPNNQPLSTSELREVANDLIELKASRDRLKALEEYISTLKSLQDRERDLSQRELEMEKRLIAVIERERDAERNRGDQLQAALNLRNRRPGFGCVLKKIVTIGLGRCG